MPDRGSGQQVTRMIQPNIASPRVRERDRLLRRLSLAVFGYWFSLGAVVSLGASTHGNFAIASLVTFLMSSVLLPLQIAEAAKFLRIASPVGWALMTFVLGPVGAVVCPAMVAQRLSRA
jgi:hypothetical protein